MNEAISERNGNQVYSSIRLRIATSFVLVALTPMFLVVFVILYEFNHYSNEMVYAQVGETVQKHQQSIDYFNRQKLNDIRYLSRSFKVSQFRDNQFLQDRLRLLQEEYGPVFVDLGLIDSNGVQVSYAGPFDLCEADYSDAEWFKRAARRRDYISDVFLGLRGYPHFIVAVKMESEGSEWLLRATIDFVAFNTLVENLRVGKTGTAVILNREGDFQTRPPVGEPALTKRQYLDLFTRGDEILNIAAGDDGPDTAPSERTAFLGIEDNDSIFTLEKQSEHGGDYIVVAAYLKSNEWMLVFQQERDDAFSDLRRSQGIAGIISLIGSIVVVIMTFVMSGRIVRLISRLNFEKEVMNQQVIESGKLASVGELAAGIAHEINNPVAIMVEEAGWCEDLLDEGMNDENLVEVRRAVQQIQTQGKRCKEITHKLLSFARKTDSRIETIQLNEIIEEVVDLLSQKSRYANVDVEVNLEQSLPTLQASITEVQQVLMNLLHNAVDAMEQTGGKIIITTSLIDTDKIKLSIADNGPGIPAINIDRIFDPFFTTKPVGKGTGLGLSICYGIVKKMGGSIDVKSQVGKGATFNIILPLGKVEKEEK
jgi:two-component system, NtrC family, sensor kinase